MVRKFVPQPPSPSSSSDESNVNTQQDMPPINLLRGWPSPSLLPTASLLAATTRVLSNHPLATPGLLYGPDEGHLPLRQSLATWLTNYYADATNRWRQSSSTSVRPIPNPKWENSSESGPNPPTTGTDRMAITGGASQSLGVILSVATDPLYTRRIWIVAPGYFMVYKIFEDAGFVGRLRAVPEIQSGPAAGPDIEWLRREMQKVNEQDAVHASKHWVKPKTHYEKIYRHVIYTVPSFANPSSLTSTLATREALVRCARDFDALVICDDVYDMLLWPADPASESTLEADGGFKAPLPRVLDIDRYLDGGAKKYGNVVSNGSFSKICAPGVRCGWVEAEPVLAYMISQAGTTKSGGAPSQLTSLFLHSLLTTPTPTSTNPENPTTTDLLTHHITRTLLPSYRRRHTRLLSAIHKYLTPHGITTPQPDRHWCGGYFVWLTLPEPLRGEQVAARALDDEGVVVAKGEVFEVPGGDAEADAQAGDGAGARAGDGADAQTETGASIKPYIGDSNADSNATKAGNPTTFPLNIRLCFAWLEEDELEEGVRRLGRVVARMLDETKVGGGDHEGVVGEKGRQGGGEAGGPSVGEFK